jgi:excisionase family DNA binding protein
MPVGDNTSRESGAITADAGDRDTLERAESLLDEEGTPRLVGADGASIPLPDSILRALRQVAHHLANGRTVQVVATGEELTTQEAADMLQVSRPYLVKLLEEGGIPFVKTGAHRRIRADDLMEYKRQRDVGRRRALARLTQMSQEMRLYDERQ